MPALSAVLLTFQFPIQFAFLRIDRVLRYFIQWPVVI